MEKNASYCIFCGSPNSIVSGPTSFCKPEDQIGHLWAASSLGAPVSKLCTQTHTMKRPPLRQTQTNTPHDTPACHRQVHRQQLPKTAFPYDTTSNFPRQHFRMSVWTHSRHARAPTHDATQMSNLIFRFGDIDTAPIGRSASTRDFPWAPGPTFVGPGTHILWVPHIFVGPLSVGPHILWILGQAHWTDKNVLL